MPCRRRYQKKIGVFMVGVKGMILRVSDEVGRVRIGMGWDEGVR